MHVASLPITAYTENQTSLQYWLKLLLSWSEGVTRAHHNGTHCCEGMRTGLALRHASYGQISLSIHDMQYIAWSTSNLFPKRTSRWELLRCPVVPTAERIVELPLVEVEGFNGNVVNQLETPLIFAPGRLTSVCSGLIFSQSYHRMVFFSYSLVLAILLREVLSCSLFLGAVLSWLLICLVAARESANSRSATAEKIGFCTPAFFLVAICNCRDKYIVHNCIQLRQVLLDVGHCSDAISQLTFEPVHKCCISCLRFCLWCSSLAVLTVSLPIPQLICRIHFHFQCSHPDTFSHLLWC